MRTLHHRNAPLSMAQCGSKGSALNISQMISCLGQQNVGGARIQNGFVNRTLPHFPVGSLEPDAKGFVEDSFYSGLTATEFFFHTMGGREGLVDTAVKTAETGYMARRLMKALEDLSMQYDSTVRNSEQLIVQFTYGPSTFKTIVGTTVSTRTCRLTASQVNMILDKALLKYNMSMIQPGEAIGAVGSQSLSEPTTQMTLKNFHFAGVASMNVTLGVPRLKEIINASKAISTPIITAKLLEPYSLPTARIVKAQIENTTLGEVSKYIREVHCGDGSYVSIKLDMEAIRRAHINIDAYTVRNSIAKGKGVKSAILKTVTEENVSVIGTKGDRLRVYLPETKPSKKGLGASKRVYFIILGLKTALPSVIVQGISTVSRAVVNEESQDDNKSTSAANTKKKSYHLLVEGSGLQDVMGIPGIDAKATKSNHIMEMQTVLGIEAARTMIADEIKYIMKMYAITVDRRHLMLLSDVMTFKGEILGITRFGISKMCESVLALASFEKTTDHLFDGAVHSRQENIVGVSECIIMGVPIPIGTGIFKLLLKIPKDKQKVKCVPYKRLLDDLGEVIRRTRGLMM